MFDVTFLKERSLLYRRTRLLCPAGHGVHAVNGLNGDGNAILSCGCLRGVILPLADGRVSVENLGPRATERNRKFGQELFPIVSAHREWELGFAS